MNKPTAQEVWERINRALETNSICAINLVSKKSTEEEYRKTTSAVFELVKQYAQAFAQEKVVEYEQKTYDIDTLRLISNETQSND